MWTGCVNAPILFLMLALSIINAVILVLTSMCFLVFYVQANAIISLDWTESWLPEPSIFNENKKGDTELQQSTLKITYVTYMVIWHRLVYTAQSGHPWPILTKQISALTAYHSAISKWIHYCQEMHNVSSHLAKLCNISRQIHFVCNKSRHLAKLCINSGQVRNTSCQQAKL